MWRIHSNGCNFKSTTWKGCQGRQMQLKLEIYLFDILFEGSMQWTRFLHFTYNSIDNTTLFEKPLVGWLCWRVFWYFYQNHVRYSPVNIETFRIIRSKSLKLKIPFHANDLWCILSNNNLWIFYIITHRGCTGWKHIADLTRMQNLHKGWPAWSSG